MCGRDEFASYHPAVSLCYFVLVIGGSTVLMHPVCLIIALGSALLYRGIQKGSRTLAASLRWLIPVLILAAVTNPAFNHRGRTALLYLPTGNPLTLESILYGLAAAAMLGAVILWFACCSSVLTSDKFVYLFGRVVPALSLVLSMTLRFVPEFRHRLEQVRQAQRGMGQDVTEGPLRVRLSRAVRMLSILITWSLERAIGTADSMKSRGYGLPGRTAFSIYRMEMRDRGMLLWLGFCGFTLLCGGLAGGFRWSWFPAVSGGEYNGLSVSFFVVYAMLSLTPSAVNLRWSVREKRKGGVSGEALRGTE